MNASKEKQQRLPSPDGMVCSICLEAIESTGKRSVARLKCSHVFHLDCIGSAFNAKGAMQCPNCRQVEGGQWLYSGGSLMQQEEFVRNDYARIQTDMAYLHDETHEEGFHEVPRWLTHSYGHYAVSEGEEDPLINSYPYPRADDRQHQGVPRYQTGGMYRPSTPSLDAVPASEMARRSANLIEVVRPLHQGLRPSHTSAMYVQSLQPILPRSYEQSSADILPDLYPSHMLERPGYRRRMDDAVYEEDSMHGWPVRRRHSTHRGPSDMGIAFNATHMHGLLDFGLQGHISSLDQSNTNRMEVTRYGPFARRAEPHPSYVSSGLEDFASRSFGNGYDSHSAHFNSQGAIWMGRRIPQL